MGSNRSKVYFSIRLDDETGIDLEGVKTALDQLVRQMPGCEVLTSYHLREGQICLAFEILVMGIDLLVYPEVPLQVSQYVPPTGPGVAFQPGQLYAKIGVTDDPDEPESTGRLTAHFFDYRDALEEVRTRLGALMRPRQNYQWEDASPPA